MDDQDLLIRNATYRLFADLAEAPGVEDVALATGRSASEVDSAWRRLHDAHALVLAPAAGERAHLLMANPFSAVPTAFRVHADGRSFYANCAWDAFGVCAALGVDGWIATRCADCGDPIDISVVDEQPDDATLLFHCLVPAARWWDSIAFT